jgi:hypothetical protein
VDAIEVGLVDVRAADSILIRYDFQRDGFAIFQASRFEWEADDEVQDPDWQEVAFVQAWARESESPSTGGDQGAECNCNPVERTGGGHDATCPDWQPECTCYELIGANGGHQPGCYFHALARAKDEGR